MTAPIIILVGTMSGTAAMVADELALALKSKKIEAHVVRMEKARPEIFKEPAQFIICTSTYGDGDVPDNAKAFFAALQQQRPDLSAVRYGVFGLGDQLHHGQTFCFGCKKFDALISELGGRRIGEREEHNHRSSVYPEDHALEWLERWLPLASE